MTPEQNATISALRAGILTPNGFGYWTQAMGNSECVRFGAGRGAGVVVNPDGSIEQLESRDWNTPARFIGSTIERDWTPPRGWWNDDQTSDARD